MKHLFLTAPLLSLALLVPNASAQDEDAPKPGMETDWLEFVKPSLHPRNLQTKNKVLINKKLMENI